MTTATTAAAEPRWIVNGIDFRNLIWVALVFVVMIYAVAVGPVGFLRFFHILTGILWTGADLLLGFLIGPILRSLDFPARRAFTLKMAPKNLFFMSTVGIVAPTSGYFLAGQMGYLDLGFPEFWWVIATLGIAAFLAVQGLGFLLPSNLRVYFEIRKDQPDGEKVQRILRSYFRTTAIQGTLQIVMVAIMVKFTLGL
jgi:hypothetical protein